ncbi:PP2C family protein-serine/threonine phosphatase [Roseobacter sinensis]|uniref:Protein phosphatase 2C domain-containing protein n=1 Tax=Roseobacter sinensis TaxID=2931391 RepID=A0ABT3BHR7_9RHOB|nr:protein phosphatase 2C domain-containing protein [Roseobacter sp. WL0113]MCV3273120.1 protein phosphatase 2C domain-containing protein [Roseobacter sp. WL0113]
MAAMPPSFDFDAASALSQGRRSYQEDAVIADFSRGSDVGLAVLADGMGGHAAGDVASKIVVTEVFSELMFQRGDPAAFEETVTQTLLDAAMAANACLRHHVAAHPETHGMGATLVATVILNRNLYWISVGDSPLFLFRNGTLSQLNEDHSMAPQIDFMVKSGLLNTEEARCHPDRNTLTSVLFGEEVPRIDCPDEPLELRGDDVLIVASDGLQFLTDEEITEVLVTHQDAHSSEIADNLLARLSDLQDPDLDNVSFSIVKLKDSSHRQAEAAEAGPAAEDALRRAG